MTSGNFGLNTGVSMQAYPGRGQPNHVAMSDSALIWCDVAGGSVVRSLSDEGHVLHPFSSQVACVDACPDLALFVTGHRDGSVRLWQEFPPGELKQVAVSDRRISAVCISPKDNNLVAIVGGRESQDEERYGRIWVWSTRDGVLQDLKSTENRQVTAAWSPDGKTLYTGGWDHCVHAINVASGESITCEFEWSVYALHAWSSGEGVLVGLHSGEVVDWRKGAHQLVAKLRGLIVGFAEIDTAIIIATTKSLYALDKASYEIIGRYPIQPGPCFVARRIGDELYFGNADELWRLSIQEAIKLLIMSH